VSKLHAPSLTLTAATQHDAEHQSGSGGDSSLQTPPMGRDTTSECHKADKGRRSNNHTAG